MGSPGFTGCNLQKNVAAAVNRQLYYVVKCSTDKQMLMQNTTEHMKNRYGFEVC